MALKWGAAFVLLAALASADMAYAAKKTHFADDPEPERHYTSIFDSWRNGADPNFGPVDIKAVGNPYAAKAGGRGVGKENSAVILFQVNRKNSGRGVPDIGDGVGDGSGPIALPATLALAASADGAPPGGCGLVPTEFRNAGDGAYTIRVAPDNCAWVPGTYNYVVHVKQKGDIVGSGPGALIIP